MHWLFVFQQEDDVVKKTIDDLLRDHLVVLSSSKTSEEGQSTYMRFCVESIVNMLTYFSPTRARCSRVNLVHGKAVWQCGP